MNSYDPNQPSNPFAAGQPAAPKRGGSGKIILLIVALVVVLPMCCCGGCAGFFFIIADKSPAKNLALAKINTNATCVDKLGQPIEVGLNNSNYNTSTDTATAQFTVSGPKGSASVDCQADKVGEEWVLTRGTVQFPDGTTVDLLAEPAANDEPVIELQDDPNEIPLGANRNNGQSEADESAPTEPARDFRN